MPLQITIEINTSSLYARIGKREWWIKREDGQPLKFFAQERSGNELLLWGLGFFIAVPWRQ